MSRFTAFIVSLALFVAALAAYGFLFVHIGSDVAAAAADRAAAAAAGQQEDLQKTVQSFVADTASARTALASYVVTDADVVSLIQELEDAAAQENVSFSVGTISTVSSGWQYHETLRISLVATGTFASLAAFSADLESLPQASHLAQISFEATEKHMWKAVATVEFVKAKTSPSS